MDKESACNAGDTGNVDLIPGWEWFPGGGNGNPFHYSCLENPMDRGDGRLQSMRLKESDKTEWLNITTKRRYQLSRIFFNLFIFNWRMITILYWVLPYVNMNQPSHTCLQGYIFMKPLVQILLINMETVKYEPSLKNPYFTVICPHLITYFSTLVTSYCH